MSAIDTLYAAMPYLAVFALGWLAGVKTANAVSDKTAGANATLEFRNQMNSPTNP